MVFVMLSSVRLKQKKKHYSRVFVKMVVSGNLLFDFCGLIHL